MARPPRIFLILGWLVIISLISAPLSDAAAAFQAAPASQGWANLPDDPAQAAKILVEQIYGPDESQAQAAVSELLRRAGIPLVSIDGPVIAVPDQYALYDAALYNEMVPDLTRSVRRGDFYTPEQLATLLDEVGISPGEPLAQETLVAGLGQWGKAPDSPVESQFAGAAVRALAGRRLEVLYMGADLGSVTFDPLQTILILAHATSRTVPVTSTYSAAPSPETLVDRLFGVTVVHAQDKGPCDDLDKTLTPPDQVQEAMGKYMKDKIIESWKDFALNDKAKQAIGTAGSVYEKGTAVLNVLLLLMGAQINISDDKGGQTHFKHEAGDRSKHVKVRALAYFDSTIAKKKVACYKLAGIEVPPPGPLEGFRVRWSLNQSLGRGYQGKFLTAVQSDSQKIGGCGSCGEVTGSDGRSSVELYPPVEKNPGKGEELFGNVRVTASLDKDDFPFKLSDLLGLSNPGGFAAGKIWDLAVSAISRAGLPSQSENIRVGYHGSDIFVAKGKSNLFLFYVIAPVELDVVTCKGLEGPWKGRGGMGGDNKTIFGSLAESITGQSIPENVQYMRDDLNFMINPDATESIFDIVPEIKMTGSMQINQALLAANRAVVLGNQVGREAGEVDLQIANQSLAPISFFGTTTFPIYQVPEDPRCPPGEYEFETIP